MNLSVYDGYANSASQRGSHDSTKLLCGDLKYYRNVDDRFILSPRNRLIIRYDRVRGTFMNSTDYGLLSKADVEKRDPVFVHKRITNKDGLIR